MVGEDEVGIAKKLWNKFKSESVFAMYTPFFVTLASGTLDPKVFVHCIAQDVQFLSAFAHAYELAEDYADDEDERNAISKLRRCVHDKLKTHDTLVSELGFELPEQTPTDEVMVKYTEFLLSTSLGKVEGEKAPGKIVTPFEKTKVAAYILGAIAPCMRLLAFISNEIQVVLDPNDSGHPYKKWVDNYCSENFEASAFQTEDVIEKLSVYLTGEELEVLEKLYHRAMRLEVDFFSAQPVVQRTIIPLSRAQDHTGAGFTIFCDFDLACSTFDSSAVLAEIAIITAPKLDPEESEGQLVRMPSAELRSTWRVLSTQYAKELEDCIESIVSSQTVTEFDYEGLNEALGKLANFEKNANSRIVQSGVLKGLTREDIMWAGERLVLQDGCRDFFQAIIKNENLKTDVHVLSFCWCDDLIKAAFSSGELNELKVHSNELAYEESVTTGEIITTMESPNEKLQTLNKIMINKTNNEEQHLTVYIGGSVGDLLCLLEADIGIVVGTSSTLRRLGDQFGVSFVPLFSGLVEKQRHLSKDSSSDWKKKSGVLYTVTSWSEIHAFILGS